MQYLGGKSRLARRIAKRIWYDSGGWARVWDPFVGGLSCASAFAEWEKPVLCSDAHLALINMYLALADGWEPPSYVSEEMHREARDYPDSNPRKAFIGYGCSFMGGYFNGYARNGDDYNGREPWVKASNSLKRAFRRSKHLFEFQHLDFLAVTPRHEPGLVIYCDPPYEGTTGYKAAGDFDHGRFWNRILEWEAKGVPCYVSEFSCPLPNRVVWEHERKRQCDQRREQPTVTDFVFRLDGKESRREPAQVPLAL